MHAIEADDDKSIDSLAAAGADDFRATLVAFDPQDAERRTPLMLAYWWGKPLAAAALVNAGSDYQQQDAKGRGSAWYARRFGKGQSELDLTRQIEAGERRISMESVISKAEKPTGVPPKRRQSGL